VTGEKKKTFFLPREGGHLLQRKLRRKNPIIIETTREKERLVFPKKGISFKNFYLVKFVKGRGKRFR